LPRTAPGAGGVRRLVGLSDRPDRMRSSGGPEHGQALSRHEGAQVQKLLSSTLMQKLSWKGNASEPTVRVQSMLSLLRNHILEPPAESVDRPARVARSRPAPEFRRNAAVEARYPAFYPLA